jgi:hypothetical protein
MLDLSLARRAKRRRCFLALFKGRPPVIETMEADAVPDELILLFAGPFSDVMMSGGRPSCGELSPAPTAEPSSSRIERETTSSFTHPFSSLTKDLVSSTSLHSAAASSPSHHSYRTFRRSHRHETNQFSKEPVSGPSRWTESQPVGGLESLLTPPPSSSQNSCSLLDEADDVISSEEEEEEEEDGSWRGPRAYLETRVATPAGLEFSISYSLQAGLRIRIHFIRIRIQHSRLKTNPDPDPIRIRIQSGSRALMTKNWKKITAKKKNLIFLGSKTAIFLSPGLHKVRPGYRRSLQLSKEAIQHFKT